MSKWTPVDTSKSQREASPNSRSMPAERMSLNDEARVRDEAALAKLDGANSAAQTTGKNLKSVARKSNAKRFHLPELEVTPGDYTPGKKNPIHSVLTALPVLMLGFNC